MIYTDETGRTFVWVEQRTIPPSRKFRRVYPYGLLEELRAQSPMRLLLNAVAGVLLVGCVVAFGVLVL